ncbi:MAG: alanine racemase [Clostridia bacterium]|nr:alanine racemase [Clostridia bacterium]
MSVRNRRIVDPEMIRRNVEAIRGAVPASAEMMAVVKADGYGHGAVTAAKAALRGGATALAVATEEEGRILREAGIRKPEILVLGAVSEESVEIGVANDLTLTVCTPDMVRICRRAAEKLDREAAVHLKIDSGMGRIGVRTREERDAVLAEIRAGSRVKMTGVYTHFSDADGGLDGERYSRAQFEVFLALSEGLGVRRHCANSAAALRHPEWALEMVREGISIYGYPPVETGLPLNPCMRWEARVSYVKEVPAGAYISYGRTWQAPRPSRIATVTCGYGDGYHRAASGRAEVLIRGKRAPIVGRICMDQMMADVTDIPEARAEDPVVLMGTDGSETITAEDIARWSGTISYEVLLSRGSRVEMETVQGNGEAEENDR